MAEYTARRGILTRILLGSSESELTWSSKGLCVSGGGKSWDIPTALLTQPLETAPGAFWARLHVSTAAESIVLRGFSATDLRELCEHANGGLKNHAKRRLKRECEGLSPAEEAIAALFDGRAFVRDSARKVVVDECKNATAFRREGLWEHYSTERQRDAFARVAGFVKGSKKLVRNANSEFVENQVARHKSFFDTVESQPLTDSQRLACVIDEDNDLVLAGAGTGKTSTMIGRAGYVIAAGLASPDQLLMIAYGRKAAGEMQDRQDSRLSALLTDGTPKIKTFHALGLEIIGEAEGRRPDISPMAEDSHAFAAFVDDQLELQCEDRIYQEQLVRYCGTERFPYRNPFDFDSMQAYNDYVVQNELRTLMRELVKSFEEVVIANLLNKYGIPYTYEAEYEIATFSPERRQYRPDFYLPEHKIYIEHFALDRRGRPPSHFRDYLAGVEWKRALHEQHGTTLIETYSYLKREDLLESTLLEKLASAGVELHPRSDEEMLAELRESSEVAEFATMLADFIGIYKQSGLEFGRVRRTAESHIDSARLVLLLDLLAPILHAYNEELHVRGHIDFADMIQRATDHVESGRYRASYTHIMVDEFQDISAARARLVMALRAQMPECSLFVVGDDWQAIYRFAGSDIQYTRDFNKFFGATATTALETTFRFNNQIGDVASPFVLKNPAQIRKKVESLSHSDKPTVSMVRTLTVASGLTLALEAISAKAAYGFDSKPSVLVLARFNFVFEDWSSSAAKRELAAQFPALSITFSTVHAAKGKEADFVVILGLERGKYGFPSSKSGDEFLDLVLPEPELFPFAEERRLFYVALTRARNRVYLVHNPMVASQFVHELLEDDVGYPICRDEFHGPEVCAELPHVPCPTCGVGSLVPRASEHGQFAGCSAYPRCRHLEQLCPECGSLMRRGGRERKCTNASCDVSIPVCRICGGSMVERVGPYGKFLGCTNYRGSEEFSCTHKEKIVAQR